MDIISYILNTALLLILQKANAKRPKTADLPADKQEAIRASKKKYMAGKRQEKLELKRGTISIMAYGW